MKLNVLIVVIFVSKVIYGQSNLNYGFFIHPKLSTFIYEESETSKGTNTVSYSLGGDIYFNKNQLELKSGISLNRISVNQIDYSLIFGCDIDFMNGTDIYNSYSKDNYQIYYIGIPLNILYYFNENGKFYANLGVEFFQNIGESKKSFLVECGNLEREISGNPRYKPRDSISKVNIGFGYMYKKEKYSIYFEPKIEYSITKIFKESGIISNLTNNVNSLEYGLRIGFKL